MSILFQTKEAKNADKELKKRQIREYETVLAELSAEHREFFENLYGYSGSRSFSRRTKSVLSGE